MQEMSIAEIEEVSGGADSAPFIAVAVGATIVGGMIAVVALPAAGAAIGVCALISASSMAMSLFAG